MSTLNEILEENPVLKNIINVLGKGIPEDKKHLLENLPYSDADVVALLNQSKSGTIGIIDLVLLSNTYKTDMQIAALGEYVRRTHYTNAQLIYALNELSKQDILDVCCAKLMRQTPSDFELCLIVRKTNTAVKYEAWTTLCKMFKAAASNEEDALMDKIAYKVSQEPELLITEKWHDGKAHSLAGWACELSDYTRALESSILTKDATLIAATIALPNYAHLFYEQENIVRNILHARSKYIIK